MTSPHISPTSCCGRKSAAICGVCSRRVTRRLRRRCRLGKQDGRSPPIGGYDHGLFPCGVAQRTVKYDSAAPRGPAGAPSVVRCVRHGFGFEAPRRRRCPSIAEERQRRIRAHAAVKPAMEERGGRSRALPAYGHSLPRVGHKPRSGAVTLRADGGRGRSLRCSSSTMLGHRLPPRALISTHETHRRTALRDPGRASWSQTPHLTTAFRPRDESW